jgi:hypothetical protein
MHVSLPGDMGDFDHVFTCAEPFGLVWHPVEHVMPQV